MAEPTIPDLTFPGNQYGSIERPWDLRPLLYRGGAGTPISKVADRIAQGDLGTPIKDRIPLAQQLHEHLAGKLAGGGGRATIKLSIAYLRNFYTWTDITGRSPTLDSIEQDYIDYSEHLLHRVRVLKDLSEDSAHSYACCLSQMLNEILELKIGLVAKTRLTKARTRKRVLGTQADKQNLEHMAAFGRFLLDITDALTLENIRGTLPVTIRLRSGQVLEEACYLKPARANKSNHRFPSCRKEKLMRRAALGAETPCRTRSPLINLRMEAELLIFISQTGLNLAQAGTLKMGKFRYQSHLDGYRIYRVYKGRRSGEVEFEIYSEYRALFERYLQWREGFASADEDRLFPFVSFQGRSRLWMQFQAIQKRCKLLGLPCFRPQKLRRARVNWLLRRSRDPQLTAEMAQHSQETLLRNYDEPHHQVSVVEISRFLSVTDPAIPAAMPGPGICAGNSPHPEADAGSHSPRPDCISPAGCLFCYHHRDVDTEDHVWSLATYRHFKSVELVQYRPPTNGAPHHPAIAAIDRITAKLKRFEASSDVRALWVREALARVEESDFHPKWDGFIQLIELRA